MTRRIALAALVASALVIAASYASAFLPGGAPPAAAWGMALGVPAALVAVMVLGAVRPGESVGRLAWPFAFVGLALAVGFGLALALPANESAASPLYLGLPLRAAVILYGIGLMPIAVLPVAYALTFRTQTLSQADVDRVRAAGEAWARGRSSAEAFDGDGRGTSAGSVDALEAEPAGTVGA
jgi:hypothetical protein